MITLHVSAGELRIHIGVVSPCLKGRYANRQGMAERDRHPYKVGSVTLLRCGSLHNAKAAFGRGSLNRHNDELFLTNDEEALPPLALIRSSPTYPIQVRSRSSWARNSGGRCGLSLWESSGGGCRTLPPWGRGRGERETAG